MCGKRQRVAADPRAQVDDEPRTESASFVPGDRFCGCLLDSDRLDPHRCAPLEFDRRLAAGLCQAHCRAHGRGWSLLPQTSELCGAYGSGVAKLLEQLAAFTG